MPHVTAADRPASGMPLAASLGGKSKGIGPHDGAFGALLEPAEVPAAQQDDPAKEAEVGARSETLNCVVQIPPLPSVSARYDLAAFDAGEGAQAKPSMAKSPESRAVPTLAGDRPDTSGAEPLTAESQATRNTEPLGPVAASRPITERMADSCEGAPGVMQVPMAAVTASPARAEFAPISPAFSNLFAANNPLGSSTSGLVPHDARSVVRRFVPIVDSSSGGALARDPAVMALHEAVDVPPVKATGPQLPASDGPEAQEVATPKSGPMDAPAISSPSFMAGGVAGAPPRQQDWQKESETLDRIGEAGAAAVPRSGADAQVAVLPPRAVAVEPTAASVHVSRQLAEAVGERREGAVEVALAPEELGKVRLRLHVHDGVMSVSIQAERAETLDLMRRHADILARDFRELGFRDVAFSFAEHSGQRTTPPPDPEDGGEVNAPMIEPPRPISIPLRPSAAGRGLDLRM